MLDFILRPWRLLVLFLASQLNREQQRLIKYLQVENQILRGEARQGPHSAALIEPFRAL